MRILSTDCRSQAAADLRACRLLLRGGSRSFFVASLLLPREVRHPASALYAFCRLADDAVDINSRKDALAILRERLRLAYEGRPLPSPIDRAFADVVALHHIPPSLPEALLEGLEWDATAVRYETLRDLEAYAARVAGAVGAMMSVLMGRREPDVLARACDLGVAMQFTNIARDVGEDARNGRLYLPLEWMREAGIDPDRWLHKPMHSDAIGSVVARLLTAADTMYERAQAGVDQLPLSCRPGIHAARLLYAEIGRQVARNGWDSVTQRAVVPGWRKAQILPGALLASCLTKPGNAAGPLDATDFLVAAACASRPVIAEAANSGRVANKVIWVLELFERLERREPV
jgi:15-cis-phytoene synthase